MLVARYCEEIRISGLVQGVGFRPMVWKQAQYLGIRGEVRNDSNGVNIIAQANPETISRFIEGINNNRPPLAVIQRIDRKCLETPPEFHQFSITASQTGIVRTSVVADAATCAECLAEIKDPGNRRYRHAFANCTHCGPRISITQSIPYDRINTSMAEFEMCERCAAEYHDPENRRFHAQPTCCPDCGPTLELWSADRRRLSVDDVIETSIKLIKQGSIIAVKGVGGFQLACLASLEQTVSKLRQRKNRPDKPLALMAANISQIRHFCELGEEEARLLQSPAAPIVLLKVKNAEGLSPEIAPGQYQLGFMLPNNPLHHLLMQGMPGPLVLTSGNAGNEPQCIDNDDAMERLGHIADYLLLHDRDIINRIDDSLLRVSAETVHYLRRARGYAPQPLPLPEKLQQAPGILACGAQMKNTFAIAREGKVTLSQHIGNLENPLACKDFETNVELFLSLLEAEPSVIAIDLHPDYQCSRYGEHLAQQEQLPLIAVQHHHAHIAGCLADNLWPHNEPVLGVAFDGLGLGNDGQLWGGEFLLCDYRGFERIGSLLPVPLAGGNLASVEPWRNTVSQLTAAGLWQQAENILADLPSFDLFRQQPVDQLIQAIHSGNHYLKTSSAGRLFDAVAGILGISAQRMSYEGQAATELETLQHDIDLSRVEPYRFAWLTDDILRVDPAPMWQSLLADLARQVDHRLISARFHAAMAHCIVESATRLSRQRGIQTVALSGGVFQNQSLLNHSLQLFSRTNLSVLQHRFTPCNDGGIAYGQAVVASAISLEKS